MKRVLTALILSLIHIYVEAFEDIRVRQAIAHALDAAAKMCIRDSISPLYRFPARARCPRDLAVWDPAPSAVGQGAGSLFLVAYVSNLFSIIRQRSRSAGWARRERSWRSR